MYNFSCHQKVLLQKNMKKYSKSLQDMYYKEYYLNKEV